MPVLLDPNVEPLQIDSGCVLLRNRRTGTSHEIGADEFYLLKLLQNMPSAEDALQTFRSHCERPLTSSQVTAFVADLQRRGLITQADTATDLSRSQISRISQTADFVLDLTTLFFGWLLHPLLLVPVSILALAAAKVLLNDWQAITGDLYKFMITHNEWTITLIVVGKILALSLANALIFGMACRRWGGWVSDFGFVLWGGFIPYFHIDIGNSLAVMRRNQRRHLRLVAVLSPLALGSASLVGWAFARPGSGFGTFCLLLLLPCAVRLVLQVNIFFKYSAAYLALCDTCRKRRILESATSEFSRWLCGLSSTTSGSERFWLRVYGAAYAAYHLSISVLIAVAGYWIATQYNWVGLLLTAIAECWWNRTLLSSSDHELDALANILR